jgi:hypothetical protein
MVKTEEKGKQRRGLETYHGEEIDHLMRNALALAKRGPTYKKLTQHTRSFSHISN